MLRTLRKKKGLSMKALGEIVGVSETAIHHYEVGDRFPPLDVLLSLADFFDVSLDFLIRGKEKEPSPIAREKLVEATTDAFSHLSPEAREIALAVLSVLQSPQE